MIPPIPVSMFDCDSIRVIPEKSQKLEIPFVDPFGVSDFLLRSVP
jgi:hypothetical protein